MKKCTEISELLSAYADNELTNKDKLSVEEHLAACENCSALLELYSEISLSVDETSVPVPDALRIGVMNRIRSESVSTQKVEKKKKWWQHQTMLTRLAPIAACLVVVLLVWQFSGNIFSVDDSAPEAAMPMLDGTLATSADNVPPPAASAPHAEYAWDLEEAEAAGVEDDSLPMATTEPDGRIDRDAALEEQANREHEWILKYIGSAYAEITLTGELPEFFEDYLPLPLDNWSGWDFVYEIPSTEVNTLMEELINRPGVSLVRNPDNQNSVYAVVFFSSGT